MTLVHAAAAKNTKNAAVRMHKIELMDLVKPFLV